MGGSDSFCAICRTSIGTSALNVGSRGERAKRIRKQVIEAGLRQRAGQKEEDENLESDESDDGSDASDFCDRFDIEHSYDPEVMESRDAALPNHDRFIDHVRLVVCDPGITKAPSNCFVSGPADVDSYGWGNVNGGHPERPDEEFTSVMYMAYEPDQTPTFPCHGLCLQIAAKVILGSPDSRLLDPDVLYMTLYNMHIGNSSVRLNHGDVSGWEEQYWASKPGEEYGIMNPLEFYHLHMQTLVHLTIEREPSGKRPSSMSTQKRIADPFQKLSNELLHHITNYLDGEEVFRLRQASMIAREATNGNGFWMTRVQKDMGWLWLPHDLFAKGIGNFVDWMKVYLLFDSVTARPWGMKGVYMGLANRRRIWNACVCLRSAYMNEAAERDQPLTNPDFSVRTWALGSEVDTLWSEPLSVLESYEQWVKSAV